MTNWGLVTTVRAPEAKVMQFAEYHLGLGAAQLWLYFDDPDDPAIHRALTLPRTTVIRCTPEHWADLVKRRPERHQNRQSRNAKQAYGTCALTWLGHIDIDEFIWPARPVDEVLRGVAPDQPLVQMEPFEAMHDPDRGPSGSRDYRGAFRTQDVTLRTQVLGPFANVLRKGMLSHSAGKAFYRTGVPGLSPRLHTADLNGERLTGSAFHKDLILLHDHAGSFDDWSAALPFRLTRGAYLYQPELHQFLSNASADDLAAFFWQTQMLSQDNRDLLLGCGRLVVADLSNRGAADTTA
jgi:Glycosyl transferase family 2